MEVPDRAPLWSPEYTQSFLTKEASTPPCSPHNYSTMSFSGLLTSGVMRRVCWSGWVSACSLITFVLLTSGCQAVAPVVPEEVYQQVNQDSREWTYDTAWQNIRQLNADLSEGDITTAASQALFIASQMERLDTGSAGPLSSAQVSNIIKDVSLAAAERTTEENLKESLILATKLQDAFDSGDFAAAQDYALAVFVVVGATPQTP